MTHTRHLLQSPLFSNPLGFQTGPKKNQDCDERFLLRNRFNRSKAGRAFTAAGHWRTWLHPTLPRKGKEQSVTVTAVSSGDRSRTLYLHAMHVKRFSKPSVKVGTKSQCPENVHLCRVTIYAAEKCVSALAPPDTLTYCPYDCQVSVSRFAGAVAYWD